MNPDLLNEMAFLRELGFTHLDVKEQRTERSAPASLNESAAPDITASLDPADPGSFDSIESMEQLQAIASVCTKCRLSRGRTQVVYGVGNPNADLMFIGEAPGHDEDLQGKPFVGRAGQLLTDIIKAMKLTRDDVYIANVIKCRPPENRNPEPDELQACRPFIRRQIELIKPRVIVTLGKFALQSLTGRLYAITAARGHWLEYEGIKVMPTYHPAYLLRTPAAKKDVWQDMKKVMAELGMTP
jgi:uracil-DNA glycosylase family 4